MRAPRWALALTAAGTVGAATLVLGLPGSASADVNAPALPDRYGATARGDAFYFEVNGDEIPASPTNNAGSLTANSTISNSGASRAFAGAPFYGNTVQTLPGTVNGVPNQFGFGAFQIPFSQLPGFVEAQSSGEQSKTEEGGYYRVSVEALPEAAKASGFYGAPGAIPAPNQQQTATSSAEVKDDSVVAAAQGTSQGIVMGPLEIGHATAIATLTKAVGADPVIESKTFGQFSVNGMAFGFNQDGFQYAGMEMSSKDAIAQANTALAASNTKIDLAPIQQVELPTGGTEYVISGLRVTTIQDSPSGSGGTFEIVYEIGRALVSADAATFGTTPATSAGTDTSAASGRSDGPASATAGSGKADSTRSDSSATATTDAVVAPSLDSFAPSGLQDAAAAVPSTVTEVTPSGDLAPVATGDSGIVQPSLGTDTVQTLGLVGSTQRGDNSELLYAMLVLAGVGVLGGHFLFTRFAVAAR